MSTHGTTTGSVAADAPPSAADVLMADGRVAVIRALDPGDRDGLQALHDHVSDDAFQMRFFAVGRAVGNAYVEHLFTSPGAAVCLVASIRGQIVATATAERLDPTSAEIALLVADDLRGLGLGSLLIEHLAAYSREVGIRHLVAEVLAENQAMLRVFRDAGFALTQKSEGSTIRVDLVTAMSPGVADAADLREAQAEASSLAPILYPRHVAVVGVRRDGSGTGHAVLQSIRGGGFTGRLDVIHPTADSVGGVRTHASFGGVDGQVDLAIIAVPAEQVCAALRDAIAAHVRGVVVISSGFSELGAHGQDLQREMVRMARDSGVRIIGPNCLGILANDPEIRLNATFSRVQPRSGGLAIASQSGGVGIALLDSATELGLGVHTFISLGNKADVSGNDLLSAWLNDPKVTSAVLYLESFGNAGKFARIARRFAQRKPLLAVVGGRSSSGQRAGQSHTAAAATPAVGVDALFAQTGVIACCGAEDMAETALLLDSQPSPRGPRVAILSNAGGMGVLAADVADTHGLVVPEFSDALRRTMSEHVSGTVGLQNPVDVGAAGSPDDLGACVEAVLCSDEVDAVLVVLVATAMTSSAAMLAVLADVRGRCAETPVLLVTMGIVPPPAPVTGVTRFRTYEGALEALGRAAARAAWLARPAELPATHDEDRARLARSHAQSFLAAAEHGSWLTAPQTADLLAPYGLDQSGMVVADGAHGVSAAEVLGYPVALKVADPEVQHKTDRGLVRTAVNSAEALSATMIDFQRELGRSDVPVLVQPMVSGVELALGVVNDPSFGPMIRIAAGGIATNLLEDQTFLLPPVSARSAEDALRGLRMWPLLDGYRGAAPAAVDGLVAHVVALAALAEDLPELAELDLNPVIVTPESAVIVDAKVRLAGQDVRRADMPRQLAIYT